MIVVTGANGQLGTAFSKFLPDDSVFLARADLDLADLGSIVSTISMLEPTMVINCAAYTAVDLAEANEDTADRVNAYAVGELARVCRDLDVQFVTFSTDYVFDGEKDRAYVESDEPNPSNAYGRSKLRGELLAMDANPDALVVRTSWLLSGTHPNFARTMLRLLKEGDVSVVNDQIGRPTLVDDLAPATLEVLDRGLSGVVHLANEGVTTWYELARQIADIARIDKERVHACTTADYPTPAARPANSVLDSERVSNAMPRYEPSLVVTVQSLLELS